MKKGTSKKLANRQAMDLDKLASMADKEIDTSDIPEVGDWSGAERGLLDRPIKKTPGRSATPGGENPLQHGPNLG